MPDPQPIDLAEFFAAFATAIDGSDAAYAVIVSGGDVVAVPIGSAFAVSLALEGPLSALLEQAVNLAVGAAVTSELREQRLSECFSWEQMRAFMLGGQTAKQNRLAYGQAERVRGILTGKLKHLVRQYCTECFQLRGGCRCANRYRGEIRGRSHYVNGVGDWVFSLEDVAALTRDMLVEHGVDHRSFDPLFFLAAWARDERTRRYRKSRQS